MKLCLKIKQATTNSIVCWQNRSHTFAVKQKMTRKTRFLPMVNQPNKWTFERNITITLFFYVDFTFIGMLVSVAFMIITITIHICIPQLRNIHGKCFLGYLINLTCGYVAFSSINLSKSYIEPFACKSIGYFTYFTFLSAILWLNVINFNIWRSCRWINILFRLESSQWTSSW